MTAPVTPALVRDALASIPAAMARGEWAKVGMAIKSEFPDEDGFALFDQWSATADGYKATDVRSTWQSIKAGGGVGIGTLFRMAQENGFSMQTFAPLPASAAAVADDARRAGERAQRIAADNAQRSTKQAAAALQAIALWDAAIEAPHAYLARKGVQAYGVRVGTSGALLVPLRDDTGQLCNVQSVAAVKPVDGPDKLFLSGGRKSGLWHELGTLAGADVVLIAEGYATAASLHEATEHAAVVAFDAGNLVHVAKALRKLYPSVLLVLCGDDDKATHATTGTNPGRDKATAAAKSVRGAVAFPEPLSDGQSDFNDLHQALGLDAVRVMVEAVIEAHRVQGNQRQPRQQNTNKSATATPGNSGRSHGDSTTGREATALDVFYVADNGVWFVGVEQDGKRRPPEWVCSRLDVAAHTRDQDDSGWGYLLEFEDARGIAKQWAMPARMLSGDGGEYRAALLNMGLHISTSPKARNLLSQYIQTRAPGTFAQSTDHVGWHGHAFVLPRETIGDDVERIIFQTESLAENTFRSKGAVDQWRERVGNLCAGNSRLVFAVSCAFAGPLLHPGGVESGGFHLRGDSSSGKTTALRLAASVYGGANYMQRWKMTGNAIEAVAARYCDSLLILDELAQVDPKEAGDCAYMLANGQGKGRANRTGMSRLPLTWRLLFLSAGELSLADHMAEGMKRTRTGQEVRMADIPADAGAGMGAFENLHGHANGAAFARHLTQGAAACYGSPGRAFIEWACANADTLRKRLRVDMAAMAGRFIPSGASGQVERVGGRFALVGVAGELATECGLTGWEPGEAERGAKACFDAWLLARGGDGNGEVLAMLRQARGFIEMHGAGRFPWLHRGADDHVATTINRAGVRRMLNEDGERIKTNGEFLGKFGDKPSDSEMSKTSAEYLVLAEPFRNELCKGYDYKAMCRVLIEHECMQPDEGNEKGRVTHKARLPGIGLVNCYLLTPKLLELDL